MIGKGFVSNIKKKKPKMITIIKFSCVGFAFLILVGYALTVYFLDDWSKMGIVISISISCMDLFNYILY